jgi:hypothetical protein
MVKDMNTTREQKEANTVHTSKVEAKLRPQTQRWLSLPSSARIDRNHPWSQPSCVAMPFRLGASYAPGTGQVPV